MPTKKARVIAGKKRKREPLPETIIETDSTDEEKAACVPAAKKVFCLVSVYRFVTVVHNS